MSKAESSKAAASNGVKPNPNAAGGANKVWVIGVDKDQSIEFGTDVTLTSMIKRVDVAVKNVSQQVIDGTFKGGTITNMTLKDDGVGLVRINKLKRREDYRSQIQIPHHPNIPHRTISFTKTGRIIGPQTMQI